MSQFFLPLRQRQLLDYLKHSKDYITGQELARLLSVSSRTIRNDIVEINKQLARYQIQIISKHSAGYILEAADPQQLKSLTKTEESFVSRTERLRHIAYRLSLSDTPISLDDLADEMYISKTTLEHDLKVFRREFLLPRPHIQMFRKKNSILFESDERKRRYILCHLYSKSWDYNARGNTFFHYRYLDEKLVNICIAEINYYLDKFSIELEDINVVHLNLIIAISILRIREGHFLTTPPEDYQILPQARNAADELLNSLELRLHMTFSEVERMEICHFISCCSFPVKARITKETIGEYFPDTLMQFADEYLQNLKRDFDLNFRVDMDFYISLLIFLRYLQMPIYYLNHVGISKERALINNVIELEIAVNIQPLALSYYGNYLDFTELLYLSFLIKGALSRPLRSRLKAILLCHYNYPIVWDLHSEIRQRFLHELDIPFSMPMYRKDNIDFSEYDLILTTTTKRNFTDNKDVDILRISPYFDKNDELAIAQVIRQNRLRKLYNRNFPGVQTLLREAVWHEQRTDSSYFQLLDFLGNEFITKGYVDEIYLTDIFRRERMMSFANHEPFILVYSPVPAKETHIEVATLLHRITVNNKKIRMVIMFCMEPSDRGLVFKFLNDFYSKITNAETARFIKTKEEFLRYLDTAFDHE